MEKISDVVDDVTWLYDVILVTSLSQYITSQTDRQQTGRRNSVPIARPLVRSAKKERVGKIHKVTRRYVLAICGADTPRPIPIQFGMRVAHRNLINVSNFCNKIFRGFRSTGGQTQSPHFPPDFAGHRYNGDSATLLYKLTAWLQLSNTT